MTRQTRAPPPDLIDTHLFGDSSAARRLVQLLAVEARPRTILLVGGSIRLLHQLEDTFPEADVWRTSVAMLAGAPMSDAVVSVFGIADSRWTDTDSLDRLLAHLKPHGHLAFLEPASRAGVSKWLGTAVRPALTRLASARVATRTALEVRGWFGLWHNALFVGRLAA